MAYGGLLQYLILSLPARSSGCAKSANYESNLRYAFAAAAEGTNIDGFDIWPSMPSGSIGGANCQGLANMSTKNTDRANRSMPTKLDLLLRRSFFQGVASCRGTDSSGKHQSAAGRLEQV